MASPDLNIGPNNGPVLPVPASRAVIRVTPVLPRPVTEPGTSPLGRSGLDVRGLLVEPDMVVVRSKTPSVALDVALEQARGALVRNQPADALSLLDAVWEGARSLETGWYLRGSSLALLGLPGEADKLTKQAIDLLPQSVALRFLQSVARLALGDVSGARAALAEANGKRPNDILLQVHDALLLARQGDRAGAERLLRQSIAQAPDHPAVAWGRAMLRQALRDGDRMFDDALENLRLSRTPVRSGTPVSSQSVDATEVPEETGAFRTGDLIGATLKNIGAAVGTLTPSETIAECRAMLTALAAGGTLAMASSPARAYAARGVLTAIIDALQQGGVPRGVGWEATSVDGEWRRSASDSGNTSGARDANVASESATKTLQSTVRALLSALRDGKPNDVSTLLRRANGTIDGSSLSLLQSLSGGDGDRATPRGGASIGGPFVDTASANVRAAENASILNPLRLGLALLPANDGARKTDEWMAARVTGANEPIGWGAAEVAAGMYSPAGSRAASPAFIAIVLGAVAAVAAYNAHPVLGVMGLGAAVWVWLSRGSARRAGNSAWGETRR